MNTTTLIKKRASTVSDYFSLLKPNVMTLVVFTGFAGLVIAPGNLHPFLAFVTVLCIAIGAGSSGAMNMWWERDSDRLMKRTRGRALPMGRIHPEDALIFAVVLNSFAIALMGLAVGWLAAGILAFATFFYVVIYTIWLKPRTIHNIVIGGAAGAFPPMLGWAAVTGNVSWEAFILFAIIFLWTPPHFWALAIYNNEDYKNAGIPMLPVVKGAEVTRRHILFYTLILIPVTLAPYFTGMSGVLYGTSALITSGTFAVLGFNLWRKPSLKRAHALFGFSVLYLFLIFMFLIIDYLL